MPNPRLTEGSLVARNGATSMIDISDGLASDLGHICRQSRVGAEIWQDKLPISPLLIEAARDLGRSPEDLALRGGEDFELLFTIPLSRQTDLTASFMEHNLAPPAQIGRIVRPENGINLLDTKGEKSPLNGGFEHFKQQE